MAERMEILIGIQEQVEQCRRLARDTFDKNAADRLYALADEIEQRARVVDLE